MGEEAKVNRGEEEPEIIKTDMGNIIIKPPTFKGKSKETLSQFLARIIVQDRFHSTAKR